MSSGSVVKSVHQRLLNVRDQTGEQFNHLLMRDGLERLLYRLHAAGYSDSFVLKGAMLFALWRNVPGRPTRDIDLLGFGDLTHERLRAIFGEVCNTTVTDDGLLFEASSIQTDDIRDDQEYHGIRVRSAGISRAVRLAIQIDVGFGDALVPAPEKVDYPAILEFPMPRLRAYHPATVVAEKLNAMVVLGVLNSRMKDFRFQLPRHALADECVLPQFQIQQHVAQVLLERGFLHVEFGGRLLEKRAAQPSGVQIEYVDVHQLTARHQQVDFQSLAAELFFQAPHPPVPIVERVGELRLVFGRGRSGGGRVGRGRHGVAGLLQALRSARTGSARMSGVFSEAST